MRDPTKLWKEICITFARQSKCKTRQVGCVIVKDDHLIGQGWNGAPYGSSCEDCIRPRCNGDDSHPSGSDLDKAMCAHAELNAIGYCARFGISTQGATMYIKCLCCFDCAKLIIASGITKIIYFEDYSIQNREYTLKALSNSGIIVEKAEL